MKCPVCDAEGKRSIVTLGEGWVSKQPVSRYYDEDENFHLHDPNPTTYNWRCSNGHQGTATTRQACQSNQSGCGFVGGLTVEVTRR
jgi:hypothetical protein